MALESRSSIKRLFAAALVLLGLHYVFIARYGEPYPAVTMPSFAGTRTTPDGDSTWLAVIARVRFADDSTAELLPRELLAEAPPSHRMPMMRSQFNVQAQPQHPRPETREWLQRRLQALYPDREPILIAFVWDRERARFVAGSLQRAREHIGAYTVALDETAR